MSCDGAERAMRMRLCGVLAALGGFWLGSSHVSAQDQPVKTVFENYALLGIFASDCNKPASKENFYYVHRLVNPGHVQRDRMSGPTTRDYANLIDKAAARGPNEVLVRGTRVEGNRKGEPVEEIWRVEPSRLRIMEGSIGGGKIISGGIFLPNHGQMGWFNKCLPRRTGKAGGGAVAVALRDVQ
jgi:hypothetical protein